MNAFFKKHEYFFINIYFYYFQVCGSSVCMSVCGYVHESAGACRSQKRALDSMELESQAIVNNFM